VEKATVLRTFTWAEVETILDLIDNHGQSRIDAENFVIDMRTEPPPFEVVMIELTD
jgi:hypothetical protein